MEHEFWHTCWENNKIAFHQLKPHKLLVEYFSNSSAIAKPRVLVPLCGKSLDMLWMMEQGAFVIGCELSEIAVKQFFVENNLDYHVEIRDDFSVYTSGNCIIYCGDFFKLNSTLLGQIDLVYDRAALIALPAQMRQDYVAKIIEISAPQTQILLIVINYIANEYVKPPFAISDEMVANLYGKLCVIDKLCTLVEPSELGSRLNTEGIKTFDETAFLIKKASC